MYPLAQVPYAQWLAMMQPAHSAALALSTSWFSVPSLQRSGRRLPAGQKQPAGHGRSSTARAPSVLLMSRQYEPAAHRLPAACDAYERGVSLAGMSKAYALPGIRVGWLATRSAEILDKVARLKTYTTICGGTADELLARIALKNGPAIISRNLGILRANLALAEAFFAAHADRFEFVRPRVGTVVFPRLARDGAAATLQLLFQTDEAARVLGDAASSHGRLQGEVKSHL